VTSENKVRENRLRRVAERRGWKLTKSRRRDPLAIDYGRWFLRAEGQMDRMFSDLDGVEAFLGRRS
jgi:hypothetical protein